MRERVHALLDELFERNELTNDDVISILFTATPDIHSGYPATAARTVGLRRRAADRRAGARRRRAATPLCIRVLAHLTTERPRAELHHVYLEGAKVLRDDLAD